MKEFVFLVFSTVPDEAAARSIARTLVDERLAACVNLQPGLSSIYRWDGAVREDAESMIILKTAGERLDALTARLKSLHPCELPEIVAVPVSAGLPAYLQWVMDECRETG